MRVFAVPPLSFGSYYTEYDVTLILATLDVNWKKNTIWQCTEFIANTGRVLLNLQNLQNFENGKLP